MIDAIGGCLVVLILFLTLATIAAGVVSLASEGRREILSPLLWLTTWAWAFTTTPILIIDRLVLGHAMPGWCAGSIGIAGGLLTLLLRRRLLNFLLGLSICSRVFAHLLRKRLSTPEESR